MPTFSIQNRKIGEGQPAFIIAELSGNHHQSYEEAVALVKAAKEAGADAVKLQTYTPDTITLNSRKKPFIVGGKDQPDTWKGNSLYELYQTAYTPWDWQPKLKKLADGLGIILFSSPFDATAVDFLDKEVGVPAFKVASYEAVHIPLLKKIAQTGKPVIMSVGFASPEEIDLAVKTLRENGASQIAILHCVTGYADVPNVAAMNLATIADIRERYGVVAGFSDNNGGVEMPVAAVVTGGAAIIEKHLILDRQSGGPDARFSVNLEELKRIVQLIRRAETGDRQAVLHEIGMTQVERAMGKVHYGPASPQEEENKIFRPNSVWAKRDVQKGEELVPDDTIRVARPTVYGSVQAKDFESLAGKRAKRDIEFAEPIMPEDVE